MDAAASKREARAPVHALDHVIVAVRELGTATAAYATLLGREPSWRGAHPALGTANALFRVENTYLELLSPAAPGPGAAELLRRLESEGEGLVGLALATDDAGGCAAEWRARGLAAGDPVEGEGREAASGAVRRWRNVPLPLRDTRGVLVFGIEHLSPESALPVSAATADRHACVSALDHVVIASADPEAARALYGERLGLRLALDRSFEARGLRLLFFRIGGVTVEISARLGAEPDPDAPDRCFGLAWRVPDADAARARLAGAGVDVSEVRAGHKPGTRVVTVQGATHDVATLLIEPAA
jgi:catechol 2,3-dioxygenase-like lactoylglutathione lyase family enzyme